jgi:hypothetical protein
LTLSAASAAEPQHDVPSALISWSSTHSRQLTTTPERISFGLLRRGRRHVVLFWEIHAERHVMKRCLAVFILLSALSSPVCAQTVDRAARGPADKDIRIGLYVNVQPDCTSGPLPTIRLSTPPAHGKVTVKSAKVKATNYKQCLALEVPGFVAFYRSAPGFSGSDVAVLEVKFPNGRTEVQKITVTVGSAMPSQPI